jgi:hypothetical protein
MAGMIAYDVYDVKSGMRVHKYIANCVLTPIQNLLLGRSVPNITLAYELTAGF